MNKSSINEGLVPYLYMKGFATCECGTTHFIHAWDIYPNKLPHKWTTLYEMDVLQVPGCQVLTSELWYFSRGATL